VVWEFDCRELLDHAGVRLVIDRRDCTRRRLLSIHRTWHGCALVTTARESGSPPSDREGRGKAGGLAAHQALVGGRSSNDDGTFDPPGLAEAIRFPVGAHSLASGVPGLGEQLVHGLEPAPLGRTGERLVRCCKQLGGHRAQGRISHHG